VEGYSKGRLKERNPISVSMIKYVLDSYANHDKTKIVTSPINPDVPTYYLKDPVRRLLEREQLVYAHKRTHATHEGDDVSTSRSGGSSVNSSNHNVVEKEGPTLNVSILDRWDAEFSEIKAKAASAEAKLAIYRSSQVDKVNQSWTYSGEVSFFIYNRPAMLIISQPRLC
jgi:hypothetical protein